MSKPFDTILKDLEEKPLALVATRGGGKTTMAKYIVDRFKQAHPNADIRAFDSSTAWWHGAPLSRKFLVRKYQTETSADTLYEVGYLDREERRLFLTENTANLYRYRYTRSLNDPHFAKLASWSLICFEEAHAMLLKTAPIPTEIHDWASQGRNFKMTGLLCIQRPAEIKTEIVERCNQLVGYIEGHNNRNKVRGATSDEFMERLAGLEKYEFAYYNGRDSLSVRLSEVPVYPEPELVSSGGGWEAYRRTMPTL